MMLSTFELPKQWLQTANEKYLKGKHLTDEESLKDPETEPYKSKYAARKIFDDLWNELSQFEASSEHVILLKILCAYELGSIGIETEELSSGETHLELSVKLLDEHFKDEPQVILLWIVSLNQLGYLWCSRGQHEKACQLLIDAETRYHKWNEKSPDGQVEIKRQQPLDFLDMFYSNPFDHAKNEQNNAIKNLEKAHTLTLYYLAQAFEKSGQNSKSAMYCHGTLKRQWNGMTNGEQVYDVIDWSLNAATLSQYFACTGDFNAARHHIACAQYVLSTYDGQEEERINKSKADLDRIVVKFSLMLLDTSINAIKDKEVPTVEDYSFLPYLLNEPQVEALEKQLMTFPITKFEEATKVFNTAVKHLNGAKSYYTLEEHCSDYVECVQDHSKLYMNLTAFEVNRERKCRMFKRRIDLLEGLIKELNPQYFLAICRQIMFELGEVYSQMADLKISLLDSKPREEKIKAAKKVNLMLLKAIENYDKFIKTFADKNSKLLPTKFDDDYVRPILLGYFSIGRLYSKLISIDPREQLKNWKECELFYMKVKDYLRANPEHENCLEDELPLLNEMIELIPGKMQMILNSTMY